MSLDGQPVSCFSLEKITSPFPSFLVSYCPFCRIEGSWTFSYSVWCVCWSCSCSGRIWAVMFVTCLDRHVGLDSDTTRKHSKISDYMAFKISPEPYVCECFVDGIGFCILIGWGFLLWSPSGAKRNFLDEVWNFLVCVFQLCDYSISHVTLFLRRISVITYIVCYFLL